MMGRLPQPGFNADVSQGDPMLKRFTAAALVALIGTVATPALAKQGHGSDKPSKPAVTSPQAQKPPKPGLVWVNTGTGVYHREGSRHYGKTSKGEWMTEAEAKAKGHRLAGSPGTKENDDKPAAKPNKPGKPDAKAEKPGKGQTPPGQQSPKPGKGH
jgi:hypothetical protein